jgi:O-antigen/teichoic acid export membrane protein
MTRGSNSLLSVTDIRTKSALVFLGIFAQYGLLFVAGILIARYLGAEILGRYQLGISLVAVLSVFTQLGFNQGIVKFVPLFREKRQFPEVNRVIRFSFSVSITVASLIAVLLSGFPEFFAELLFHDRTMKGIVYYSGFYLVVCTLLQLSIATFDSYKRQVIQTMISKVGVSFLFVGTLIYIVFSHSMDPETLLLVRVVIESLGIFCLFLVFRFWISEKSDHPAKEASSFRIRELIGFSFPLLLVSAIQVVITNIDILMIGWFMTVNDVGIYTICVMISRVGFLILTAVNSIIAPMISEHQSGKDTIQHYERILKISTRWLFGASANILLLTVIFSSQFLGVFGKEFENAEVALWILTIGTFIHLATGPTGTFLVMSGNQGFELGNSVFLMFSNIALNALLIPIFGIIGAAAATTISILLNKTCKTLQIFRLFGISPFDYPLYRKILLVVVLLLIFFMLREWIANFSGLYRLILGAMIIFVLNIGFMKAYLFGHRCSRDF